MEEGLLDWDMTSMLEQLGDDRTLLEEVLAIFLRDAPEHLAALGLAIEQGNAEKVATIAHTMKGELGYLGVPKITQKARELEQMGHTRSLAEAEPVFRRFEAELCALFRSVRASQQ